MIRGRIHPCWRLQPLFPGALPVITNTPVGEEFCTHCGQFVSVERYAKTSSTCYTCHQPRAEAWAAAHPERARANQRAWAETHPHKIKASQAKYRAKNRETLRLKQRIWRARHKACAHGPGGFCCVTEESPMA